MFGKQELGKSHKTKYFSITKKKDSFIYKRDQKIVQIVGKKINLNVLPLSPINLPNRLTNHFVVDFPEIYLSPEGKQIIFLSIPIEIGVFVNERLVDTFGFTKPEFTLYGPVKGGIISRIVKGEKVDETSTPKFGYAIMPLRIKNYNTRVRRTSKILINSRYLDFYYGEKKSNKVEKVSTEMIKLDIKGSIKVRNMNKCFFKGMTKVKAKTQLLKKEESIDMRWGI